MITPHEEFEDKTALILDVIISNAGVGQDETWFRRHADLRIRYMHSNNAAWRKWLESRVRTIDPRDQCVVWIKHWFAAYCMDRVRYQDRHPEEIFTTCN
jgi:hypothetical protein